MEAERLPRGADPTLHTKLGRGGLSDVEWTVQLLQMEHAADHPALRTTNTLEALEACVAMELMTEQDAQTLRTSWMLATSVRDALMLVRGRASDSLPSDVAELSALAGVLRPGVRPPNYSMSTYESLAERARLWSGSSTARNECSCSPSPFIPLGAVLQGEKSVFPARLTPKEHKNDDAPRPTPPGARHDQRGQSQA